MRCRKAKPFQCLLPVRVPSATLKLTLSVAQTFFSSIIQKAAHCENDRESGRPIVVKMGVIHIQDNGTNAQMINIDYFASHPQYRNNEKYYDIALIKLKSFIRFDEHVRPACVSSLSKQWPKAIAIGFGKTQYGELNRQRERESA